MANRVLSVCLLLAGGATLPAQPLDALQKLVVPVQDGSGIVVRASGSMVLVTTAGHVLGAAPGPFMIEGRTFDLVANLCPVNERQLSTCPGMDLALLVCHACAGFHAEDLDVAAPEGLEHINEHKLGLFGMLSSPTGRVHQSTDSTAAVIAANSKKGSTSPTDNFVRMTNLFGFVPLGLSGGVIFDERGRLRGIQSSVGVPPLQLVQAVPWESADEWIESVLSGTARKNITDQEAKALLQTSRRLRPRSESLPAIDPGETELSVGLQTLFIPGSGTSEFAPSIRISRPLPGTKGTLISGDLTFAGPSALAFDQTVSRQVLMPALTAQYPIAQNWGPLRRSTWLGGLYLGGGAGWLSVTRRLRSSAGAPDTARTWVPVFETGWRLRMPRKGWGFQANYREVVTRNGTFLPDNRLKSFSFGAFLVLK